MSEVFLMNTLDVYSNLVYLFLANEVCGYGANRDIPQDTQELAHIFVKLDPETNS